MKLTVVQQLRAIIMASFLCLICSLLAFFSLFRLFFCLFWPFRLISAFSPQINIFSPFRLFSP
ncbi:unnamed protein product [Oikopleura dioica]|uniref:Uncharacterized protein n=1 Tax=Oikopleura dioica TaxID=34765 RepID=E4YEB6_OIKDI|nr:unnamed protein product [Oikopleura dioica]